MDNQERKRVRQEKLRGRGQPPQHSQPQPPQYPQPPQHSQPQPPQYPQPPQHSQPQPPQYPQPPQRRGQPRPAAPKAQRKRRKPWGILIIVVMVAVATVIGFIQYPKLTAQYIHQCVGSAELNLGRGNGASVITMWADDTRHVWFIETIANQPKQTDPIAVNGALADDACFAPSISAKLVIGNKGNRLPDIVVSGDGVNTVLVNPGPDPKQPLRTESSIDKYYPDGVPAAPTPNKNNKH